MAGSSVAQQQAAFAAAGLGASQLPRWMGGSFDQSNCLLHSFGITHGAVLSEEELRSAVSAKAPATLQYRLLRHADESHSCSFEDDFEFFLQDHAACAVAPQLSAAAPAAPATSAVAGGGGGGGGGSAAAGSAAEEVLSERAVRALRRLQAVEIAPNAVTVAMMAAACACAAPLARENVLSS
eukprot:SAG11_NODE_2159_length_3730_cov_1.805288_4_plen_182_part_00